MGKEHGKYLWYYYTLSKEKLSIALGHLSGEALKWWNKEEYERWYYKEQKIRIWEDLKLIMCERYSPQDLLQSRQTIPPPKKANRDDTTSKHVSQENAKQVEEGKSLELTCYKCENRGHTAKDCPTKNWVNKLNFIIPFAVIRKQQRNKKLFHHLPIKWSKLNEIYLFLVIL